MEQIIVLEKITYSETLENINSLCEGFNKLKINGLDDKDGYNKVHEARMLLKNKRVELEKREDVLKAKANDYKNSVIAIRRSLTDPMTATEAYLLEQEKFVDNEKERIKRENQQAEIKRAEAMVDQMIILGRRMTLLEAQTITDEQFNVMLSEQKVVFEAEKIRLEAERIAKEEEEKRLAKQKEEQDEIAKKQLEELRVIKEQRDKLEYERKQLEEDIKNKEVERLHLIEVEKAKKEGARKAKEEAEEAERKRLSKEAKKLALLPDKGKILDLANKIESIEFPVMSNEESIDMLEKFKTFLYSGIKTLREKAESL